MNEIDPDDQSLPQLERTFTFRGKQLAPYSFNHRAALYRLGSLTDYEFSIFLVRILMLRDEDVDAVRGDAVSKFRIETGKWADKEKISRGKGLEEVIQLADQILADVAKAEELEPVVDAKKKELAA